MLATANLWLFIKCYIGLNLEHFLRAIDRGGSGDKTPTFPVKIEENNPLIFG
jgi:hypothetical protein